MDELDTKDSAAHALALLGLRAAGTSDAAVGDAPTVEEFTALYEGSLDATRRAQVLSHIAADREVYRAFMQVAAAQASLDESLEPEAATAPKTAPLLARLGSWLTDTFRAPALAGGFVAAALVVVLLIPGQQTDPVDELDDIAQIYARFGSEWQVSPGSLGDRVVRSRSAAGPASPEQQAIYLGLRGGLDLLGDEFPSKWLPAITVDDSVDALSPELREALLASGKLATLARFQCQLEGSDAFFLAAQDSLDKLRPKLDMTRSRASTYLAKVIDQPGTPSERVCDFSIATTALLSNK